MAAQGYLRDTDRTAGDGWSWLYWAPGEVTRMAATRSVHSTLHNPVSPGTGHCQQPRRAAARGGGAHELTVPMHTPGGSKGPSNTGVHFTPDPPAPLAHPKAAQCPSCVPLLWLAGVSGMCQLLLGWGPCARQRHVLSICRTRRGIEMPFHKIQHGLHALLARPGAKHLGGQQWILSLEGE